MVQNPPDNFTACIIKSITKDNKTNNRKDENRHLIMLCRSFTD